MPTGYTAKLVEDGQTFEQFVLTCARAFGALIEMRDDDLEAPIPEAFEVSDYYPKLIDKEKNELARLEAMTSDEREAFGAEKRQSDIKTWEESITRSTRENIRIMDMEAMVAKWEPPSPDHHELQKFMLEQLNISKSKDGWQREHLGNARAKSNLDYWQMAVESAKTGIKFYTEEYAKEIERVNGRNEWVRKLRESLATSK